MAFVLAAILAGGISYLLFRKLRANSARRNVVQVVAAASDLSPGITLAAKDVQIIEWPSDLSLAGSFAKIEDVVGKPLIYTLGAKEPILKRDLGAEGSGIGLAGKIPPGMRATAVKSNEIVGVAGFLYPGSRVDVLATYNLPGSAGAITQTVLQDVEVLTAGQTIEPDPQGKPQAVNVVTLLLSPEDSQRLLLTSGQGTIQFVLRSGIDKKTVDLRPTRLDQLISADKPVISAHKQGSPRRAPSKAPQIYVLEVIQGTSRKVEKF